MSFLKSDNQTTNNLQTTTAKVQLNLPQGYQASESLVQLLPAPKPTSTSKYDHNAHTQQKSVCSVLVDQENNLFSSKDTILKSVMNERQYKQRQQFESPSSVESLCEVLKENDLVLKCSFVRPGFSASNTCLMCSPQMLEEAMKAEGDEFNLKKVKLTLESDNNLTPQNGVMFLSIIQNQSGNHMIYSLDYHVAEEHDNKLFAL